MKYSVTLLNGDTLSHNNMDVIHDKVDEWIEEYVTLIDGSPNENVEFDITCDIHRDTILSTLLKYGKELTTEDWVEAGW